MKNFVAVHSQFHMEHSKATLHVLIAWIVYLSGELSSFRTTTVNIISLNRIISVPSHVVHTYVCCD